MSINTDGEGPEDDRTAWPYFALFTSGTFGFRSSVGRRYWRNVGLTFLAGYALIFFLIAMPENFRPLVRLVPMAIVAGLGRNFILYLRELDELSRRIQLESLAFAYFMVVLLAVAWFSLGLGEVVTAGWAWLLIPGIAEILRGFSLMFFAHRYT